MEKIILSSFAKFAIERLWKAGFEAYAVGGCVRNSLLGLDVFDYDITTSAKPDEIKKVFYGFPIFDTGIKHGTVSVKIEEEILEITTFRSDGNYISHRRPENVNFETSLTKDLKRRDFTVNAMAYSQKSGIIDLFSGMEDLKNGIIRCVGDPETRFEEDALRILRAMRFASVLNFEIEDNTVLAMIKKKNLLLDISRERVEAELVKMLDGEGFSKILMRFCDIFELLFGKIDVLAVTENIKNCTSTSERLTLFLVLTSKNISDLKCSNYIKTLVKNTLFLIKEDMNLTEANIKRVISKSGFDVSEISLPVYAMIKGENSIAVRKTIKTIKDRKDVIFVSQLDIDGEDLLEIVGDKKEKIGKILSLLLEEVISGKMENKKEVLKNRAKCCFNSENL